LTLGARIHAGGTALVDGESRSRSGETRNGEALTRKSGGRGRLAKHRKNDLRDACACSANCWPRTNVGKKVERRPGPKMRSPRAPKELRRSRDNVRGENKHILRSKAPSRLDQALKKWQGLLSWQSGPFLVALPRAGGRKLGLRWKISRLSGLPACL